MYYLDPPMMCVTGRRLVRIFIATDGSGNTATCSHQITLKDDIKPTFTFVPANVTVQCNSVPPPGTPVATDNCAGQVTITYNGQNKTNGACTDSYVLVRQWTATDACGNTRTATQRINVIDSQKPAFLNPPANVTVQCTNIPACHQSGGYRQLRRGCSHYLRGSDQDERLLSERLYTDPPLGGFRQLQQHREHLAAHHSSGQRETRLYLGARQCDAELHPGHTSGRHRNGFRRMWRQCDRGVRRRVEHECHLPGQLPDHAPVESHRCMR
jgi:hypothetical protein